MVAPWKSLRRDAKLDQHAGKEGGRKKKKKGIHNVPEVSFSVLNTFLVRRKGNGN